MDTAQKAEATALYYIPFWVLLGEDPLPKEPFAECRIEKLYLEPRIDQRTERVYRDCCDVVITKDGQEYRIYGIEKWLLIPADELSTWQKQISDWVLKYQPAKEMINVEQ